MFHKLRSRITGAFNKGKALIQQGIQKIPTILKTIGSTAGQISNGVDQANTLGNKINTAYQNNKQGLGVNSNTDNLIKIGGIKVHNYLNKIKRTAGAVQNISGALM